VALLTGAENLDVAGDRAAGATPLRLGLLESLAAIYADRLERAVRRDGPINTMERQAVRSETLSGKLDVGRWTRNAPLHPGIFPVQVNRLSAENDFSRVLGHVAARFARTSRRPITRLRLAHASGALRPGMPEEVVAPPGGELKMLPPQWSAYRPAWSIACALLSRRSLLGPEGAHAGVSVAVEPWPLLETLLDRSLRSAALQASAAGRALRAESQWRLQLLSPAGGTARPREPIAPDGVLFENGRIFAVFDAKYRNYVERDGPKRTEIYQVITAARATGARIAVLAYPGNSSPAWWDVGPEAGNPVRLATIGLAMFSYRPGGEGERGGQLLELVS